jgi:hypothetical protein
MVVLLIVGIVIAVGVAFALLYALWLRHRRDAGLALTARQLVESSVEAHASRRARVAGLQCGGD